MKVFSLPISCTSHFFYLSFTLAGISHTMMSRQGEQDMLVIFLVPVDPLLLFHP